MNLLGKDTYFQNLLYGAPMGIRHQAGWGDPNIGQAAILHGFYCPLQFIG